MKKPVVNLEESIHQKLLNQAKVKHLSFEHILKRYAMERFLYRLSISPSANDFILKGGLLLACYKLPISRPTLDIDLQSLIAPPHITRIQEAIKGLCSLDVQADGLQFDPGSILCEPLHHLDDYEGVGIRLVCFLGKAVISIKIDVGLSNDLKPAPVTLDYPTLLPMPAPQLLAYRQESVIAEKLEAMVRHHAATTRMKDFYDIWILSTLYEYHASDLFVSIQETFRRCKRPVEAKPSVLESTFADHPELNQRWQTFLKKNGLSEAPSDFTIVIRHIRRFLIPILQAVDKETPVRAHWKVGGPWIYQDSRLGETRVVPV